MLQQGVSEEERGHDQSEEEDEEAASNHMSARGADLPTYQALQPARQTSMQYPLDFTHHQASVSTDLASHAAYAWLCRAGEDQCGDPEPVVP